MPLPMCLARARVDRGAVFLDDHVAGWRNVIDVDGLDVGHPRRCVLAQIYQAGLIGRNLFQYSDDWFVIVRQTLGLTQLKATNLGFWTWDWSGYLDLTEAWRQELSDVRVTHQDEVPSPVQVLQEIERGFRPILVSFDGSQWTQSFVEAQSAINRFASAVSLV